MCYRHIKGRDRFDQRAFCGERVSADDLNYGRPRLCPACLQACPIWWAVWDLGLVTACPIHRCLLLNQCPACKRKLAWQRPAVYKCRCGLDFRNLAPEAADSDLVAINAAIYRAAGFPAGEVAELDLTNYGFPREMLELRLGPLLRLILFVGSSIREGGQAVPETTALCCDRACCRDRDRPCCSHGAERLAVATTRSAAAHDPSGSGRTGCPQLQGNLREFLSSPILRPSAQRIRIPSRCLRAVCR